MVATQKMNERENILGRIREALRVPAPVPGAHDGHSAAAVSEREAAPHIPEWLPRVGVTFEDRLALFQKNAVDLKAQFFFVESEAVLSAKLSEIAKEEGWKKVATHGNELAETAAASLGLEVLKTDCGDYDVDALEACDAGISACEALIAQTGSVLVTSKSSGGRALSILPPHHVVVARREQLIADLPAAFALIEAKYAPNNFPSMISFITGPSRTGDIERILVLGAHGPKKLTIFCIG